MTKALIVGNGGRESSIAWKLSGESQLYAVMGIENPTILRYVRESGGKYCIGDTNSKEFVTEFAKSQKIDFAFITSDASLEAGIVDALRAAGIATVGPTRAGAEIEWNKAFAMDLVHEILPEYTPRYWIVNDKKSLDNLFGTLEKENTSIVVKPQGLTGGKGVKVMGEHLNGFSQAKEYARVLLQSRDHESVVIEEKLSGPEFTLQVLTDGEHFTKPPATYDHPYRYEFDKGPGTGGMGSFTDAKLPLPFMTMDDYEECIEIARRTLPELKKRNLHYSGVLNIGCFLTPQGIRIMEFNARPGDPEFMNIMMVLDSSLLGILQKITIGTLSENDVVFTPAASVVKYLVSPEYAVQEGKVHDFSLDVEAIEKIGVKVFFSSAVHIDGNKYQTVGNSRAVALAATAQTIPAAAKKVDDAIKNYVDGVLEYRADIGRQDEIETLIAISPHSDA
ncbi:phosphoribosylamine--glycine ligase [Candidatus Uhrbacteria bacterium]|nr:phosphoribosylamine--glycine ligase [Candidatus Uhrbacteria bacterium]